MSKNEADITVTRGRFLILEKTKNFALQLYQSLRQR